MPTPAGAKPIITPMPSSPDADAAAAAAGPGSPEADALKAAQDAAAAATKKKDEEENSTEDKPDGDTSKEQDNKPADDTKPDADVDATLSLDKKDDKPQITIEETGYTEIDQVSNMLVEKGVEGADKIMAEFMENGELTLEGKAAMIEALGEGVASMAFKQLETSASSIIEAAKKDSTETMNYANEKFNGGDASTTWQQMVNYVRAENSPFTEAEVDVMNGMLEQGGLAAKLVVDKIHSTYTGDASNSVPPTGMLEGDTNNDGVTFNPISRLDYIAQMDKAVSQFGEDSAQVRDLNRRRKLSMTRNY